MKRTTKIEMTEKELANILAIHFNLDQKDARINIEKYDGDQREPSSTTIYFEGKENT